MKKILLTGTCAAIIGVIVFFTAISITFIPGVSVLYPGVAFESAFGAWFGLWGAAASYIGLLFAGTAGGWFAAPTGLLLAVSDFVQALAPMIAVRFLGLNPSIPNWRHAVAYVAVSLFFGSIPGSLFYNYVNLRLGVLAGWHSYWVAVFAWNVGNAIIFTLIGIPLLRLGTGIMKRADLFIKGIV